MVRFFVRLLVLAIVCFTLVPSLTFLNMLGETRFGPFLSRTLTWFAAGAGLSIWYSYFVAGFLAALAFTLGDLFVKRIRSEVTGQRPWATGALAVAASVTLWLLFGVTFLVLQDQGYLVLLGGNRLAPGANDYSYALKGSLLFLLSWPASGFVAGWLSNAICSSSKG